MASLTLYQR